MLGEHVQAAGKSRRLSAAQKAALPRQLAADLAAVKLELLEYERFTLSAGVDPEAAGGLQAVLEQYTKRMVGLEGAPEP